jgi:hypothetical protein
VGQAAGVTRPSRDITEQLNAHKVPASSASRSARPPAASRNSAIALAQSELRPVAILEACREEIPRQVGDDQAVRVGAGLPWGRPIVVRTTVRPLARQQLEASLGAEPWLS